jgi:hypothetical protein
MPNQRRVLQELDPNVRRGPNLTFMQRDQIIGMLYGGMTVKEVADAYGRTDHCIRQPASSTAKQERQMISLAQAGPRYSQSREKDRL